MLMLTKWFFIGNHPFRELFSQAHPPRLYAVVKGYQNIPLDRYKTWQYFSHSPSFIDQQNAVLMFQKDPGARQYTTRPNSHHRNSKGPLHEGVNVRL